MLPNRLSLQYQHINNNVVSKEYHITIGFSYSYWAVGLYVNQLIRPLDTLSGLTHLTKLSYTLK